MITSKDKKLAHFRITGHTQQGLYITMDNGDIGLIRTREISWKDEDLPHWRETYPIGWEGYAFPISFKDGDINEYSLRLAEYDPWEDFFEELVKNRVFEGTVIGVEVYGAFLEIEQGIIGLLHRSQLPSHLQDSVADTIWHGDKVLVVIRDVNHELRRLGLSLAPAQNLAKDMVPTAMHVAMGDIEPEHNLEQLLNLEFSRNLIILVEDESAQSVAVSGWLRDFGQNVKVFANAEDALDFLSISEPDMALVDVGLPKMGGIELTNLILDEHPQVQVINMTDWARAKELYTSLDEIQRRGAKLLYKPLLPEDLASLLLYEEDHGNLIHKINHTPPIKHHVNISSRKDLHNLLAKCRKKLDMENIFLFALDTTHHRVSVADCIANRHEYQNINAKLVYSPVRDAAEDGEHFYINKITEKEHKRFRYLLEFIPTMIACIGVPVPTKSTTRYALLAMDSGSKEIGDEIKLYMEGTALAIGVMLDQIMLSEQVALLERSALIGNLTSGMIHEINNLVTPLQYSASHLQRSLNRLESGRDQDLELVKSEVANIEREVRQMIGVVKTFGKISKKPQTEIMKVDEVISDAITLLRSMSKRANIRIFFDPPERIMTIRNQAVLLEQIIINVSLNAIQQISELPTMREGYIRFDIEHLEKDTCRILIHDNGPGIHVALWERIFELGFSTRQDGSGIGLYISRSLMEEIGGRIYVADSRILSGSTFALEFSIDV